MCPTVVVTGGAGYVGSHACKALAAAGFEPVCVDDLSRGHARHVLWGPLVRADIGDPRTLRDVFAAHQPVAVLHFAALAYVGESVTDPAAYYRTNVAGTLNLLDVMRESGCPNLVFSSSCATYGVPAIVPIDEDAPQSPINPYGRSKLMVEQILSDYASAYGGHHAILRYFNAAGADSAGEIGEHHEPETHLLPLAILTALGRHPRVDIFGTDYPTPDGTAVRDYVHVDDLARAHVLALRYLLDGGSDIALNLGAGTGWSVREVIAAVERIGGRPVHVRQAPRRPGDPPTLVADATHARDVLGWTPVHDTDAIVETAWAWHAKARPASGSTS